MPTIRNSPDDDPRIKIIPGNSESDRESNLDSIKILSFIQRPNIHLASLTNMKETAIPDTKAKKTLSSIF